jgi:membrane associated rhomboid family serine protease
VAIVVLVSVIVVMASGHYIRPAITTHLLAFALGILCASTLRRRRRGRRRTAVRH